MRARRFTLDQSPFAEGTGRGITVAVVDSGVHAAHPHVGGVAGGVFLGGAATADDFVDRIGHGTAVAAAIHEKAPHAELLAVKVFDRALVTSAETLARAIIWAADQRARVVNLSLGTQHSDHTQLLRDAVEHATRLGALVVSARAQSGVRWLPGSFPEVVGVSLDWECARDTITARLTADGLTLAASGYPRPIPGVPRERNLCGVSFSVANVSGFLARLLSSRTAIVSLGDVQRELLGR